MDIYFQNRSELPQIYLDFTRMVKTQFGRTIKNFHSDNVMEYKSNSFLTLLRESGTLPHRSCPGTSQQNGPPPFEMGTSDMYQNVTHLGP